MAWVLNMATGVDRNIPGDDPKDSLIKAVLLARKAFDDESPAPERAEVEAGIKQANRVLFYGDYTVLAEPFKARIAPVRTIARHCATVPSRRARAPRIDARDPSPGSA
jgi:hypothetical protein